MDNHQLENTKLITNKGGGWTLSQNKEFAENFKKLMENLLKNPNELIIASNQIKKLSKDLQMKRNNKSAAKFFADVLINLINTNQKKFSKPC